MRKLSFTIKTFGCQMNVADSGVVAAHLNNCGMAQTDDIWDADIIVVNTCTVRAMAEHKAMTFLGELQHEYKNKKKYPSVIVMGCAAEQWGETIKKKYPLINMVAGAKDIDQFPQVFDKIFAPHLHTLPQGERKALATDHSTLSVFVTIMRGCDNYCSYCIVPYVRGHEKSRPADEIIAEIKELAKNGTKEVTLLGQNVNSYSGQWTVDSEQKNLDFTDLLHEVNKIKGLERIRFMTSHPKDLSDKLIDAMGSLDKMCEHVHLPLQSGSDKILKDMNRKYTQADYLKIIHKLRKVKPGISITTDILVGYPGETEKDFLETLKMVEQIQFDFLFAFKYSSREGTAASKLIDNVSVKEKESRLAKILEVQNRISKQINAKLIGTIQEVLVEEKREDVFVGSTRTNKKVFFNLSAGDDPVGSVVKLKITEAKIISLKGEFHGA